MSVQMEVKSLSFWYPQSTTMALEQISFVISPGELILLCGQSGSGKTTLLRHLKPNRAPFGLQEGAISFEGRAFEELPERESAQRIGFVAQNPENQIVTDTVWHELAFGLENLGLPVNEIRRRTAEMAEYFGMSSWFRRKVDELSGGQKQMLNLASVMVMKPDVLLLDEPTAQMDPIGAGRFFRTLQRINQDIGTTIVICEQRLEEIMPLADRVMVMHRGKLVVDCGLRDCAGQMTRWEMQSGMELPVKKGLPVALRTFLMFGRDNEETPISVGEGKNWLKRRGVTGSIALEETKPQAPLALSVEQVFFSYHKGKDVLREFDLQVEKGAIYCLLGGNGSGKTTALKVLAGIYKPHGGKLKTNGVVRYLAQNPLSLFTEVTVEDELAVMIPESAKRREKTEDMIALMELQEQRRQNPLDLSGGQQQRLALGKVLLTEPDVLLLDEPTKGVDAEFKQKFSQILHLLQEKGVTIVIVSHDLEFCAQNATHCGLMFDGTVMGSAPVRTFFARNSFYTTAAARMTQGILQGCMTVEDVEEILKEEE